MALHLDTPGDLLAAIPLLLGATPRESLVLIGIGRRGAVAPIIRADLVPCSSPEGAAALCREALAMLSRTSAASVVLAAFTERDATATLARVRDGLGTGIDIADTWVVAGDRFWSPDCADLSCCPEQGRPLPPEPTGAVPAYVRHEHRGHARAPAARRRNARRALQRAASATARQGPEARLAALRGWREAVAGAARGRLPGDAAAGRLAAALLDVVVRDAIIVDLVPGAQGAAEGLCLDASAPGVREALSRLIGADDPARPDPRAVAATIAVAERVAWLCDAASAPAHALVGIVQWWSGDDEGARAAIAEALEVEPDYRLAELVACALAVDMPPGWLRAG